jgi:AraC family transcriptional regulator, activator of mtrCDE
MANRPILRMHPADLDRLMTTLEVRFVQLAECLVSPGWRLRLPSLDRPGIHYNLMGVGRIAVGEDAPIEFGPHTLLITPPAKSLRIEAGGESGQIDRHALVEFDEFGPGELRRFVAGDGKPELILICGYFRASYGASIDLFANLHSPIIEIFNQNERLDHQLKSTLAELIAQEIGSGAMAAALIKQVLVTLLRRSLHSTELWVERFSTLNDPQIARAFAQMAAQPEAPHSVETLSRTSGLSRSAFMARFSKLFGDSPMAVLRQLRMRRADILLRADKLSVDQIAHAVGYGSRSSFLRAFRQFYGADPSNYRAVAERSARSEE